MRMRAFVLAFVFTLLLAPMAWAKYAPPPIAGHVTDLAGKLTASESAALERDLEAYRLRTSNEIAVFIPATLEGYTIEDVAFETFNAWKLGVARKDNGVLVVVAPAERKVRIEVGKGLEGTLTDLRAKEIVDSELSPRLKASEYAKAFEEGTRAIERTLDGTVVTSSSRPAIGLGSFLVVFVVGLFVIFVIAFLLHFLIWAIGRALGLTRKSYREWRRGGSGSGGSYAPGYYGPSGGGGGGGGGFSGGGGSSGGGGASGSF